MHSGEFTLYTLALVAAVVRGMLKTRVTLGNISRVLLNKILNDINPGKWCHLFFLEILI